MNRNRGQDRGRGRYPSRGSYRDEGRREERNSHSNKADADTNWRSRNDKSSIPKENSSTSKPPPSIPVSSEPEPIIGTCTELEKPYLRLTTAAKPELVRTEATLATWYITLSQRYEEGNINYSYLADQLKAVRQDLTVQRIENTLTVQVYEYHMNVAILNSDMTEFNVCLQRLRGLDNGTLLPRRLSAQLIAYQALYCLVQKEPISEFFVFIHHTLKQNKTDEPQNNNNNDNILSSTTHSNTPDNSHEVVLKHTLAVISSYNTQNYHALFKLFHTSPTSTYTALLVLLFKEVRRNTLEVFKKAYQPGLPLHWVADELAFPSMMQCVEFIKSESKTSQIDETKNLLLCKQPPVKAQ